MLCGCYQSDSSNLPSLAPFISLLIPFEIAILKQVLFWKTATLQFQIASARRNLLSEQPETVTRKTEPQSKQGRRSTRARVPLGDNTRHRIHSLGWAPSPEHHPPDMEDEVWCQLWPPSLACQQIMTRSRILSRGRMSPT